MDTSSSQFHSPNTSNPMGEAVSNNTATSGRSREMESLSLEISKYPKDLLQLAPNQSSSSSSTRRRFGEPQVGGDEDEDEDDDGLNLGLGLSLGGKFGVDKSHKGLKRSSSIIGTMPLIREDDRVAPPAAAAAAHTLVRTSSLPLETEEEWRKRKEMQTLRRMEAKRRRFEKQRVLKEGGGGGEEKGVESVSFRGRLEREQQNLGITHKFGGSSTGESGGSASPKVEVKWRRTTFGSLQGFLMAQAQQGCSQGSGESQGGSSSGASELESRIHQGSSNSGDAKSPSSIHSAQEWGSQDIMGFPGPKIESTGRSGGPEPESSAKQRESTENKRREAGGGGGMEDMPCVFTIGDGPHGRKVEGILYRYGKGEEVRIMCVCHGSFFSPAEFVKHAGGRDVEHPLRHIVVSPSPSAFQ
uniref:Ninja-family protein n=1 Tax=Opuntia streptacantha TaxID=393608 RepID=A0A7C9D520_OPUST